MQYTPCVLAIFLSIGLAAPQALPIDQVLPALSKVTRLLECSRSSNNLAIYCSPVYSLPSVRYGRNAEGVLVFSGPDPARSMWVQAQPGVAASYVHETGVPMPFNYFCVDLSPGVPSGSGAAALMYTARVIIGEGASIWISGLISASGGAPSGPVTNMLSAAVSWPGAYGFETVVPPGLVTWSPIGPGCSGYPAIAFMPLPAFPPLADVAEVYVYVSIP